MVDKTLNCRFPRANSVMRLFCFSWAGGGSNFYTNWGKVMPPTIEVVGLTLPGRESRMRDDCVTDLNIILDEAVEAIVKKCEDKKPFMLFGHSFGALMSFLAARRLKTEHSLVPVRMFVSGVSAPHSELRKKYSVNVKEKTYDEFVEYLIDLGGTPQIWIDNKDLMKLFIPPFQADYEIVDKIVYELEDPPPLSCPIDAFGGKEDIEHDLKGWSEVTTGPFSITMMDGKHFYLKEEENMKLLHKHIAKFIHEPK